MSEKQLDNLLCYFTIASSDGQEAFRLVGGYDALKKRYYLPALSFNKEIFQHYFKVSTFYWDGTFYLYNRLLPFLYDYMNRSINRADREEFEELINFFDNNTKGIKATDLIDILEFGKTLGWHKL